MDGGWIYLYTYLPIHLCTMTMNIIISAKKGGEISSDWFDWSELDCVSWIILYCIDISLDRPFRLSDLALI